MNRLAQHSRFRARLPWSVALALLLMLLLASAVSATTLTMSATDAPSINVTLNGTDQASSDPFDINVTDTREVNDGWKLQITSTQFTTGGETPKTLSTTVASITGVTVACNGGSCTDPSNSVSYPVIVPAGTPTPTPISFFNAASTTGVGDFTITPTFQVQVPANAFVGTYSSTISITISSGP